jgi:hypothetical protein
VKITDEMAIALDEYLHSEHGIVIGKQAGRAALEAALSHAAGQDGEQCRAASGASSEELARLLDEVVFAAREDERAYDHGTLKSVRQRAHEALQDAKAQLLRALSRGVPEGMVLVPREMTPEMMKAVQMYSEVGAHICGSWIGAYGCIQELWNVAIAAQRKEGE